MKADGRPDNEFEQWKSSLNNPEVLLDKSMYPKIRTSFDVGWQQATTKFWKAVQFKIRTCHFGWCHKAEAMVLKSKICHFCIAWHKNKEINGGPVVPLHQCRRNHDWIILCNGASCMFGDGCWTLQVYEHRNCAISMICCDDDAATRCLVRWSNQDYI
jgi:hypothetical protein